MDPDDPTHVARRFHALSDPTRLSILELLAGGECCVCELTEAIDAAQPRASFHLKVLRDAGLVEGRRQGRWIHYALVPEGLAELRAYVDDLGARASRTSPCASESAACC